MRVEDFKLPRYSFMEEDQGCEEYKSDNGPWVKWEDVEPMLKAYLSLTNTVNKNLSVTEIEIIK